MTAPQRKRRARRIAPPMTGEENPFADEKTTAELVENNQPQQAAPAAVQAPRLVPQALSPEVAAERQRCRELALMVSLRFETYCTRRAPDVVAATIADFIDRGFEPDEAPAAND